MLVNIVMMAMLHVIQPRLDGAIICMDVLVQTKGVIREIVRTVLRMAEKSLRISAMDALDKVETPVGTKEIMDSHVMMYV